MTSTSTSPRLTLEHLRKHESLLPPVTADAAVADRIVLPPRGVPGASTAGAAAGAAGAPSAAALSFVGTSVVVEGTDAPSQAGTRTRGARGEALPAEDEPWDGAAEFIGYEDGDYAYANGPVRDATGVDGLEPAHADFAAGGPRNKLLDKAHAGAVKEIRRGSMTVDSGLLLSDDEFERAMHTLRAALEDEQRRHMARGDGHDDDALDPPRPP